MPPQKQYIELSLMLQHMGFKHLIIGYCIHSTLQDAERGDKDGKCHPWSQQHAHFTAESRHVYKQILWGVGEKERAVYTRPLT